ncbi:MAG TPA: hypothetical protein VLA74_01510, partial [Nitrososphaeraceae archaeon]|nr:hypothetical protein [Nitrososphaeraceae archaeon]
MSDLDLKIDNQLDDNSINDIHREKEEDQQHYDKGIIRKCGNIKNNNEDEIDLDPSEELEKKNIIQKFIIHKKNGCIKLELNHKYEKSTIVVPTIKVKDWTKFQNSVEKELNRKGVCDKEDIRLIQNALDDNYDRILGMIYDDDNYINKQGKRKEEKTKRELTAFKYSQIGKGELYESVLRNDGKPFFIQYIHGSKEFKLVEKIEENSRILRPPESEEYPYSPYEFTGLEEINRYKDFIINNRIDMDHIYQNSKSIISRFNNQDDYKLTLIAADVTLSYFQDRFSTIYYDYIVGGNGSGKSSLGDTFGAIAYRAVVMTDPTAPNLFRLIGSIEPAQCTIVLEEADRIDKSPELMAILKTGSSRNGRVPKINPNTFKQEFYFSYCQKVIISERSLNHSIAKGVNTRILPINCFKGQTKYDIKEILNPTDTGGSQNKELMKELEDFRKLLLVYRLMHFKDPIPDLDIGIEGRDKELVKHLIQILYGSKCLAEIIESLQKFLDIKNQKKETSLDHALLPIISDLIKDNGPRMLFKTFWNALRAGIPGKEDEKKPNEYHTEDHGTIYRTTITGLLSDTFGVKKEHKRDGNILIFDPLVIEKLSKNDKTKIIVKELLNKEKSSSSSSYDDNNEDIQCEGVNGVNTPDRGDSIEIKEDIEETDQTEIQNQSSTSLVNNN